MYGNQLIVLTSENIGDVCRILRRATGKSQETLALDAELETSTITRIENKQHSPGSQSLIKIFAAMGYQLVLKNSAN
ncbi:helix-turn-helix domain-containing protein [Endozoicomonas lisbonensis]|uniref:Transcriptional regulator with XRE-family HTH domain n=1 Tax=Endozoicomonas lisbonensis TaxID=3120522 RepID=A0ABV2SAN6_9GAMM